MPSHWSQFTISNPRWLWIAFLVNACQVRFQVTARKPMTPFRMGTPYPKYNPWSDTSLKREKTHNLWLGVQRVTFVPLWCQTGFKELRCLFLSKMQHPCHPLTMRCRELCLRQMVCQLRMVYLLNISYCILPLLLDVKFNWMCDYVIRSATTVRAKPPRLSVSQRREGRARLVRVQVGEGPRGGKAHQSR